MANFSTPASLVWKDFDNLYNTRPSTITIKLYNNFDELVDEVENSTGVYSWTDLPDSNSFGSTYTYHCIYEVDRYMFEPPNILRLMASMINSDAFAATLTDKKGKIVFFNDIVFVNKWDCFLQDNENLVFVSWDDEGTWNDNIILAWFPIVNFEYDNLIYIWKDMTTWEDAAYFVDSLTPSCFLDTRNFYDVLYNYNTSLTKTYKLLTTDVLYK